MYREQGFPVCRLKAVQAVVLLMLAAWDHQLCTAKSAGQPCGSCQTRLAAPCKSNDALCLQVWDASASVMLSIGNKFATCRQWHLVSSATCSHTHIVVCCTHSGCKKAIAMSMTMPTAKVVARLASTRPDRMPQMRCSFASFSGCASCMALSLAA